MLNRIVSLISKVNFNDQNEVINMQSENCIKNTIENNSNDVNCVFPDLNQDLYVLYEKLKNTENLEELLSL